MMVLLASLMIATNAAPAELIARCRAMLPADAELEGRITVRNRRGIAQREYDYVLERKADATGLKLTDADGRAVQWDREGPLAGTDVLWSDLTLEYLWWDDVRFDAEREGETVNGQMCRVVVLRKDGREFKVWVDAKTGAMMQAEELVNGKPVRRLWGTRIRKFGERWFPNVMEVETLGSGHRTKITVEKLQ